MNLHKLIFVNNPCYIAGKTIIPRGIMVHSTGANNPNLKRYVGPDDGLLGQNQYNNHWNNIGTRRVCVHGFIGKLADGTVATYQTLPWNHRAWHCAGKGNDTHIAFEICEDGLKDPVYFNAVYREATELCAYLARMYGIPVQNIIGHYEGHQQGIANNHGDPKNWFPKFGKSMDTFREDVQRILSGVTPDEPAKPEKEPIKVSYQAKVNTVNDLSLNLWTDTFKSKSLMKIPKGDTVEVLEEVNSTWAKIKYGGVTGYVDRQYLVKVAAPAPAEPDTGIDRAALIAELRGILDRAAAITKLL